MTSCFDISKIDAWNTGDENVTDGSVDDYDFDWGGTVKTPDEPPGCGCRNDVQTQQTEESSQTEMAAEDQESEGYPVIQL